ncbi:MAG: diadenylate cyclase CdaA [Defluviitaleaceae bacterium]|nr:diadenylate cyclase CdaA [Defluviitaleaceae bacterium]
MANITDLFSGINLPAFSMPRFGFNSVLDIGLLTFVIYKLMMWMRETRAWTLFKGIIFLVVIYLGANMLGMDTTIWIINSTMSVVLIAAVIIFQAEIRKALERMGNARNIPIIGGMDEKASTLQRYALDEIVVALLKLSKARSGALIVIEQNVRLGDLEETGVLIDAVLTSQLLVSIFEDKTPLHDGAVLVRENRVRAATCILPLTADPLSSDLGTRHRAAVGVSEVSDAYAVVVSEETGTISIAKNGRLHRFLDEPEIRHILGENIRAGKRAKKPRKGARNA